MSCFYDGSPKSKVTCYVCKLGVRRALRADCPYAKVKALADWAKDIIGHLGTTFAGGWDKVDKSDEVSGKNATLGREVEWWLSRHSEVPK